MSDLLFDAVARIARHEAAHRSWAAAGVVTEVHTTVAGRNDHAVSVKLRDSGVLVPRVPVAVGALGLAVTPAVGDLVAVVFMDGDPHAGVVIGRLHHRDLEPPKHGDGQIVLALPPGGSSPDISALLDPATPELKVVVGDATVHVTGKVVTISIGDAKLEVDGNSPVKVTVAAGDAKATFDGNGNLTLEASQKLELKASEVHIDGSAKVTLSGGTVELN